jgi:hypothetical protein
MMRRILRMNSSERCRVLLLLLTIVGSSSCGDSTGPHHNTSGPVRLTTHLDSLFAIGDSAQLTVNGSANDAIWESHDGAVVQVTQTGRVTSIGPGDAWVVASRGLNLADSAHIVVRQRVASIVVTPAAISRPLQRTQRFQAVGSDARGVPVPNVTVTWSATGSATIDNSGVATATTIGPATINASLNGVSATATLTVTPLPKLRFSLDTVNVGVGQNADAQSPLPRVVADSISADESFTAALTVGDSNIALVTPAVVPMPEYGGSHSSPAFQVVGRAAGVTTLSASYPQYVSGSAVIHVSTPTLRLIGPNEWASGDFTSTFDVATTDSLGTAHTVAQPLAVHFQSRTAGIVAPDDTVMTLVPGQGLIQLPLRRGNTGQTWLVLSAPGYRTDSVRLSVTGAKLRFIAADYTNLTTASVGAGQTQNGNLFVYSSGSLPTDLPITITQKHPDLLRVPSSLVQPAEDYYGKVQMQTFGLRAGTDTLIASAPGFLPDTLVFFVTTPRYAVAPYPTSTTVGMFFELDASTVDSLGVVNPPTAAPARALVISSNPAVLRPSADTMLFGGGTGGGGMQIYVVGPGSATLTIRDPLGVYQSVTTTPIAVAPAQLKVISDYPSSVPLHTVGFHQLLGASVFISTGGSVPDSIHLRSTDPTIAQPMSSAVTSSPSGTNFVIAGGDRSGTAWIVASEPGLGSDSMAVSVAAPTVRVSISQSFGIAGQSGVLCYVILVDQAGNARSTTETLTFRIVSSDPSVMTADSVLTVPAGQSQSNFGTVQFKAAGNVVLRAFDDRPVPYAYEPGASPIITVYTQSASRSP